MNYVRTSDQSPTQSNPLPDNLLVERYFIQPILRLLLEITEVISLKNLHCVVKLTVVYLS